MATQRDPLQHSADAAWGQALASLNIDVQSTSGCIDAVQVARDQASLRTFLLTHDPFSSELASASGEQVRDALARLRQTTSEEEMRHWVIRCLRERIEKDQVERLHGCESHGVPWMTKALVKSSEAISKLARETLGETFR